MPFRDVIGHRRLVALLARAVHRESLPPSLILSGPGGIGKRLVASATARAGAKQNGATTAKRIHMRMWSPLFYIGVNPTDLAARSGIADGVLDHRTIAGLGFQRLNRQRILTGASGPIDCVEQKPGIRRPNHLGIFYAPQVAPAG